MGSQDLILLDAIDGVLRRMKKLPVSSFRRLRHQNIRPNSTSRTNPITQPRTIPSFLSPKTRETCESLAAAAVSDGETPAPCVDSVADEDCSVEADAAEDVGIVVIPEGVYVTPSITTGEGNVKVETPSSVVEG